jgi:hypothetical protein
LQDASKILEIDKHVPEMQLRMTEHLRGYMVDPVGGDCLSTGHSTHKPGHDVKPASPCLLEHCIEIRAVLAPLGAASMLTPCVPKRA